MTQALDPNGMTIPYRFDTTRGPLLDGDCVNDPGHDWITMPAAWNNGHNDGRLPVVSWVLAGFLLSEHPAFPVAVGAAANVDVLRIVLSNHAVWEKTALIVTYDENGGFFDHVTPPHRHRARRVNSSRCPTSPRCPAAVYGVRSVRPFACPPSSFLRTAAARSTAAPSWSTRRS